MLPLSPTEKEILERYYRGESYKQIADALGIKISTVKTHATRILVKTLAESLRRAAWLRRQQLTSAPPADSRARPG